jgi:hypothetical protein
MFRRHLCWVGIGGLVLAAGSAQAGLYTASAFDNSTISTTGPRTGTNNTAYFDAETGSGSYGYFGVIDFRASDFGIKKAVASVTDFKLTLTEDNASWSTAGSLQLWISGDTSASIDSGSSTLKFNKSYLPGGVGSQLNPLVLLGTANFTTTGDVNNGKADVYDLSLSSAAETLLVDELNTSGGNVRIVVTPDDSKVAATWAGYANTTYGGPKLSLTAQTVPEPASLAVIAVGLAGLVARKRRNR